MSPSKAENTRVICSPQSYRFPPAGNLLYTVASYAYGKDSESQDLAELTVLELLALGGLDTLEAIDGNLQKEQHIAIIHL